MANDEEFLEHRGRIVERLETVKRQVEDISDDDLRAYIKVRDILASDAGFSFDSGSSSGLLTHTFVHKCAMIGIFEPTGGLRNVGEYDAGAVQRFADLGG
jgi:hypothetical protein